MLTEFLIFFLLKFVFKKFSIVSPEFLRSIGSLTRKTRVSN